MKNAGHFLFPSPFLSGTSLSGICLAAVIATSLAPISTSAARAQVAALPPAPPVVAPAPTSWLTYKADLQRTGATNVRLGGPLNLLWRHSTEIEGKSSGYDTSPLVVGPPGQRRIYFSADDVLFCIDGQTGAQIWRTKPLARPVVSPIILLPGEAGDLILAVTSSGQLSALRTSDGAQAWQVGAGAPVQGMAPVIIKTAGGDRIMLALATGLLIATTLDGKIDPAWEVRLGSFSSSPTATPSISADGQFLYIPTQDKKVFVVDILAAKVAFSVGNLRAGAYTSPVLFEDQILLLTDTTLSALKQHTGQTNWIFDVKSALGAPAASRSAKGAMIYVGARNGKFYAVNASSGAKIWETDLADAVTGAPTIAADMILVGTRNGVLFGLAPDDGRVLWRYRLQTERVVVEDDRFGNYGNDDGNTTRPRQTGGAGRPGATNTAPRVTTDGAIWDTETTQTFGVTSQPVVLDGQVYLLADNAALYSFSTRPFDAEPPVVFNPQLSIPNSASRPALQRLDAEKSLLVPGLAPIQFVAEVADTGSGIDPASIVVKLNNKELPKTAIGTFSDITGKLLVTLAEKKDGVAVNLADGLYTVAVTARDYRGNVMNYSVNFLVDNTVPAPRVPVVDRNNDDNNGRN